MIKFKTGISGVVSTMLIILFAIAVVGIVSVSVIKVVQSPALSPELDCLKLQLDMPITITSSCYNSINDETEVKLTREGDDYKINKINFIIERENGTIENYCCGGSECSLCNVLDRGSKTYYFNEGGKKVTLMVEECELDERMIGVC